LPRLFKIEKLRTPKLRNWGGVFSPSTQGCMIQGLRIEIPVDIEVSKEVVARPAKAVLMNRQLISGEQRHNMPKNAPPEDLHHRQPPYGLLKHSLSEELPHRVQRDGMRKHSLSEDPPRRKNIDVTLPALAPRSLAASVHTALVEAEYELNRALIAKDYDATKALANTMMKLLEVAQDLARKK
jgi:hypothetical protein